MYRLSSNSCQSEAFSRSGYQPVTPWS